MTERLEITISASSPPNLQAIERAFGALTILDHKPVFCYGGTIHNPFDVPITGDLVTHEAVHAKQQGDNPAGWWKQYLADPQFRFDQEVEAYRAQYRHWCATRKDRNARARFLLNLAQALAGTLYGNMTTVPEAMNIIKR